jgi:hypothetical protein
MPSFRAVPHRNPGALAAPRGVTHRVWRRLMAAVTAARETITTWPSGRAAAVAVSGGRDPSLSRLFARFALSGLLAMVVIGAAAFVIVRRSATSDAITQAKDLTQLAGRGIVEPVITPAVLAGDPAGLARLDRVVRQRILNRAPIVRVKIWDASGRVIYSDARSLIGKVFPVGANDLQTLRGGGTQADESDLSRPENTTERRFQRLLEVYVGIRGRTARDCSTRTMSARARSGFQQTPVDEPAAGAARRAHHPLPRAGPAGLLPGAAV